jgi:phosphate transport system permease protein
VTLVIDNSPAIGKQVFDQGYTLAAVIANEFGEAANNPLHSSALFAAGLVLFVLTLVVNAAARWIVQRSDRGMRRAAPAEAAEAAAAVGA